MYAIFCFIVPCMYRSSFPETICRFSCIVNAKKMVTFAS